MVSQKVRKTIPMGTKEVPISETVGEKGSLERAAGFGFNKDYQIISENEKMK